MGLTACVIELEPVKIDNADDVGMLTLGTNTFIGQVSGTCPGNEWCDTSREMGRDEFEFDVAAGTAITAIRVSTVGTGPEGFRMKAVIKDTNFATERAPFLTGVTFPLDGQTRNVLVEFLDRAAVPPVPELFGYTMEVGSRDRKIGPGSFNVTYTLELDVQFVAP